MTTIDQIDSGLVELLALTRNETVRATTFEPSSYTSLPQSIQALSKALPTSITIETTSNPLFDAIHNVFYYIVEAIMHSNQTNNTNIYQNITILNNILRIINNMTFIDSIRNELIFKTNPTDDLTNDNNNKIVPVHFSILLSTLVGVVEVIINNTNTISPDIAHSPIVALLSQGINKEAKNTITLTHVDFMTLLTLFTTVTNTLLQQCGELLEMQTHRDIAPTTLNATIAPKFTSLPYSYQFLYNIVITTIIYLKSIMMNDIPIKEATVAFDKIKTLLETMTQLTILVVPSTSTTDTIQHTIQHPYLISIKNISQNLFGLFSNSDNTNNNAFFGTNWINTFESQFTTNFINSSLFQTPVHESQPGSTIPPQWASTLITKSPNLISLLYMIITTQISPTDSTDSAPSTTPHLTKLLLSTSPTTHSTGNLTQSLQSLLFSSVPLLLGLMSEFTASQIHTCYNEYQQIQNTQTPLLNQPGAPTVVPTSTSATENLAKYHAKKAKNQTELTPAERRTQGAKAQMAINNAITSYLITTTPLIVAYLTPYNDIRCHGSDVNNKNNNNVVLVETLHTQYINDTVSILQQYADYNDQVDVNGEPKVIQVDDAINHINTKLSQSFPSIWNDDLIEIANQTRQSLSSTVKLPNHINPEEENNDEDDGDDEEYETSPLVILSKLYDVSSSPYVSSQLITKSITTAIMCCKYINIPQSTAPTTPQQVHAQQQQMNALANDKTLHMQSQQHFNYLCRYIYPFLFSELVMTLSSQTNTIATMLQVECQNVTKNQIHNDPAKTTTSTTSSPDNTNTQPANYSKLILLQSLVQRQVIAISDIFTALAPLALSALPCQYFMHSTQPMVTILTFIHNIISYFLELPTQDYISIAFPTLPPTLKTTSDDENNNIIPNFSPLFNTIETVLLPLHGIFSLNTPFLKILSSLCYRGITLLGYITGNGLPPPINMPADSHPQLLIINKYIITPECVYFGLVYCYYYLHNFIYKKHAKKSTFQYQLNLRVDPPIIEVIEGILTLMLNDALYIQRKPFTNILPFSSPSSTTTTTTPFTLHPLTLIATPTIFNFLLRILTLGWDGDDLRYETYLEPDAVAFVTPVSSSNSIDGQAQPKEMKLIQSLFHELLYNAYNIAQKNDSDTSSTSTTTQYTKSTPENQNVLEPNVAQILIKADFWPSSLDKIPAHVLSHKLPNLQAPTLRLIRTTFDILYTTTTKSSSPTTPIQAGNVGNTIAMPAFNVFTPLRIAELLTSLYALVKFCPIRVLQFESARTFVHFIKFCDVVHKRDMLTKMTKQVEEYCQTTATNDLNKNNLINPLNINTIYLETCCNINIDTQNSTCSISPQQEQNYGANTIKNTISLQNMTILSQIHPFIFTPTSSSKPKGAKPTSTKKVNPVASTMLNSTNNVENNSGIITQDQKLKIFQDILQPLLSVNGASPDGQLLINEAYAALTALGLVPQQEQRR